MAWVSHLPEYSCGFPSFPLGMQMDIQMGMQMRKRMQGPGVYSVCLFLCREKGLSGQHFLYCMSCLVLAVLNIFFFYPSLGFQGWHFLPHDVYFTS